MIAKFFVCLETEIAASLERAIDPPLPFDALAHLSHQIFSQARVSFSKSGRLDSSPRFVEVVRPLVANVLIFLDNYAEVSANTTSHERRTFRGAEWYMQLAETLAVSFRETRLGYFESGSAAELLGNTVSVYNFVRETLGVPMRKGLPGSDVEGVDEHVSRIYYAFESGAIANSLLAAMK
jgi:hypothetical protein